MQFLLEAPATAEWIYGFCAGLFVAVILLLRVDYLQFKRSDDTDNSR